ncbi:MAG TPA: hypothetical protein VNA25_30385 [Phycisphaerae bacterium]|nr:hypothetical protein [Phycisphaerae bacterium]
MTSAAIEVLQPVTQDQLRVIEDGQNRLLTHARALVVDSPDGEQEAWVIVNGIGELKKLIASDFKPSKEASHKAWKAVCAQENGHLSRLEEPDKIVRGKLSGWETEKRRRREAEERAAREKAEAEAREAEERARREAEEKRLEAALKAEAEGKKAEAAALLEAPVEVAPVAAVVVMPTPEPPKVEGAGAMITVWDFEIVNEGEIPREYLLVNESAIRRVVSALKGQTHIPGVRVFSKLEPRRAGRR